LCPGAFVSDRVTVEVNEKGVCTLRLNRPAKRNAIDGAMVDALLTELENADLAASVNVVVVRGAGKDFCAGADLAELLASADRSAAENAADAARLGDVFIHIRDLPKPVVGVVHGRALAGGCGLATACDLVLAHEHATLGYPEVRRGFVPAMVMAMLRRAVGEKTAFDLVATGRLLTASEAAAVGLVSRVIPAATFEEDVTELVDALADASSTALALIKKQLYELDGRTFNDGIKLGSKVNATARGTPSFKESVAQFLKK
jgi:methylglutaconyl-CoA hydratase